MVQPGRSVRPAHPEGQTSLCYTPSGERIVTVGVNNLIKIFKSSSSDEPLNIDYCPESNTSIVATDNFVIVGSEDSTVAKYSLDKRQFEEILVRSQSVPVRDLALSPDGKWVAVASDETIIRIVNTSDTSKVITLNEPTKAVKHVSFDPSGTNLAASCTDGNLYLYAFGEDGVTMLEMLSGCIAKVETTSEISTKAYWHPDGRAFAIPTSTRDMQVISRKDWQKQRSFKSGHTGEITAAAWSPNGALLATAGTDRKIQLWNVKSQNVIYTFDNIPRSLLGIAWHPRDNTLSYTDSNGELYMHDNFVPAEHLELLQLGSQPAPFIHDPLSETSGNALRKLATGLTNGAKRHRLMNEADEDEVDSILSDSKFVDDDDGAGYAEENAISKKRANGHLDDIDRRIAKRRAAYNTWSPQIHKPFQPGSTEWQGDRRWLCINMIGSVLAVDNSANGLEPDDSHAIDISFIDQASRKPIKFKDYRRFDKACLTEKGVLFSCAPDDSRDLVSTLYYRPHEVWVSQQDWFIQLPKRESVTSMALSDSFIVVTTSANYVRIYTLFGVPVRVYRQKTTLGVTCASWRDYVLTIGNGPIGADGRPQLLYTIENVKRDEVYQSGDVVALPEGAELKSVFFSDQGDPCIYDTSGTLLVLLHWRTAGQARWVPLLDTNQLERRANGKKDESYWPVAVENGKFYCIILKGSREAPYYPLPYYYDIAFQVPVFSEPATADDQQAQLEEQFVLLSTELSLMEDYVAATKATGAEKQGLSKKLNDVDSTLIRLLALECVRGEERGMRGLEITKLLRDANGKMLEAAVKVANRYNHDVLSGKIQELYESRVVGLAEDDNE